MKPNNYMVLAIFWFIYIIFFGGIAMLGGMSSLGE